MQFPHMEVKLAIGALECSSLSYFLLAHLPSSPSSQPLNTSRTSTLRGVIEAQFDFSNFFELQTLLLTTLRHLAKEENSELVSTFERFRNSHFIFEAHNLITKNSFFLFKLRIINKKYFQVVILTKTHWYKT